MIESGEPNDSHAGAYGAASAYLKRFQAIVDEAKAEHPDFAIVLACAVPSYDGNAHSGVILVANVQAQIRLASMLANLASFRALRKGMKQADVEKLVEKGCDDAMLAMRTGPE